MTKTNMGVAIKLLRGIEYIRWYAQENYKKSRGLGSSSPQEFLDKIATPMYTHALKSIKRDFNGIPIMIAWQAVNPGELQRLNNRFSEQLEVDFYNNMFMRSKEALSGYMNNKWYFLNVHNMFEGSPSQDIGTHLSNKGHELVSDIIAKELSQIIPDLLPISVGQ